MSEETTQQPILKVVSGNPDDTQVAALTILFSSLAASAASAKVTEVDRNNWGNLDERLSRPTTFNPSAFQNVNFF